MRYFKVLLFTTILISGNICHPIKPKPNINKQTNSARWKREGFFSDDPLVSVRKGIQDIQTNVGRSMSSLLAAGSAIGQRMLGIITRSPRLINAHQQSNIPNQVSHPTAAIETQQSGQFYQPVPSYGTEHHHINFEDCNCNFDSSNNLKPLGHTYPSVSEIQPIHQENNAIEDNLQLQNYETVPVHESSPVKFPTESFDEYGAPSVAPVYVPHENSAGLDTHIDHEIPKPHITIEHPRGGEHVHVANILDHNNDIETEVVIHPGGSKDIDVHKVEVLGAQSVVQAASASVPDQDHPEHYINSDSDLLQDIVEVNLWYKDTHQFDHHVHGTKLKVIPHLHTG